jgi:hypothetical protein
MTNSAPRQRVVAGVLYYWVGYWVPASAVENISYNDSNGNDSERYVIKVEVIDGVLRAVAYPASPVMIGSDPPVEGDLY